MFRYKKKSVKYPYNEKTVALGIQYTSVITGTWAQTKCMAFRLCTELKRSLPRAYRLVYTTTDTQTHMGLRGPNHMYDAR